MRISAVKMSRGHPTTVDTYSQLSRFPCQEINQQADFANIFMAVSLRFLLNLSPRIDISFSEEAPAEKGTQLKETFC